jgi:hypothetical protein
MLESFGRGSSVVMCFVMIGFLVMVGCRKDSIAGRLDLSDGITVKLESLRAWKTFDGSTPEEASCRHWLTDVGRLTPMPSYYGSGSKLCAGDISAQSGDNGYKAKIEAFSSYDKGSLIKPNGCFFELVLRLVNSSEMNKTLWFMDNSRKILPVFLSNADSKIECRSFLIPGMDICQLSLIDSWEGRLGLDLAPGESSWLLVVFDVPLSLREARLHVFDSNPLKVTIPSFSAINPASTVFSGLINRNTRLSKDDPQGTFSEAEFSFTLSENRNEVIKFSLSMKDVAWKVNGVSDKTEKVTIEFGDFTRPLLNNTITALIPDTYDVKGRINSATNASGTIHIYFIPDGQTSSIDLGRWKWQATAQGQR